MGEDTEVDPVLMAPAVAKATTMGHENTAVERIDAISVCLDKVFEGDIVGKAFRNARASYHQAVPR